MSEGRGLRLGPLIIGGPRLKVAVSLVGARSADVYAGDAEVFRTTATVDGKTCEQHFERLMGRGFVGIEPVAVKVSETTSCDARFVAVPRGSALWTPVEAGGK